MSASDIAAPSAWRLIAASPQSLRTTNPIRQIVDKIDMSMSNPDKKMLSLSIGDPTIFGNLPFPAHTKDLIATALDTNCACYHPATGSVDARKAIAKRFGTPQAPLTPADVVIGSGCSDALLLAITVLTSPGTNILLPVPGFPLFQTLTEFVGAEFRGYRLLPDQQWEIDLAHLESLIDTNTRAILINNPSNPCGSVYSKEHLQALLAVAEKHHVPIISDETYFDMVFTGHTFFPLADLTTTVPILTCAGLAKRYMMPGWRLGWVLIHDRNGAFAQVRDGLQRISQLIVGANTLIQAITPGLLEHTPNEFYGHSMELLELHATICASEIASIPGLSSVQPQGAMYIMVKIEIEKFKGLPSDVEFCQRLLAEQSVLVLPGQCFKLPNYIRIVVCAPPEQLREAMARLREFCAKYHE